MTAAVTYNPNAFASASGPDWMRWRSIYHLFGYGVSFTDRTNTIVIPIKTTTPSHLELPAYDRLFTQSYADCCAKRVHELCSLQDSLGVPIKILYSGGIDSSVIITSFIATIGVVETARRVVVLMNQESIHENPALWEKFVRPYFTVQDSDKYSAEFTRSSIIVAGEGNDQLFGSDIYKDVERWGGTEILSSPWTMDNIREYMLYKQMHHDYVELWLNLFAQLVGRADCDVTTVADWWWYINFTCKWSNVFHRMLVSAHNASDIDSSYITTFYKQFFNTVDFQQWSLHDRVHKHCGQYVNYKYHARDLICDVIQDKTYEVKIKKPSLFNITKHKHSCDVIDAEYHFHYNINPAVFYNSSNSFI